MTIYYSVKLGSEADIRLNDYFKHIEKCLKKCNKIAKRLNMVRNGFLRGSDGKLSGFKLNGELPEDWKRCKDYYTYGYPKHLKRNKDIHAELNSIEFASPKGVCFALFGASSFYFVGLGAYTGVGYQEIEDRKIVSAKCVEQVEDAIGREGGSYPKGLRIVKASSVERWKEQAAKNE